MDQNSQIRNALEAIMITSLGVFVGMSVASILSTCEFFVHHSHEIYIDSFRILCCLFVIIALKFICKYYASHCENK